MLRTVSEGTQRGDGGREKHRNQRRESAEIERHTETTVTHVVPVSMAAFMLVPPTSCPSIAICPSTSQYPFLTTGDQLSAPVKRLGF